MTDEQKMEENIRLGSNATKEKNNRKMVFMQKFYKKGGFY